MKGNNPRVIVVGGGTCGMSAALALADLGVEVLVIESSSELGGNAGGWACMATSECARCSACTIQEQARRLDSYKKS